MMGLILELREQEAISLERSRDIVLLLNTPKGRGVFAARDIAANIIIDTCPVLVLDPVENKEHVEKTSLFHYTYNWPYICTDGKATTSQAVVLGLGSMFNHAVDQNVGWKRDVAQQLVTYRTLRPVKAGEELCISYGARLTFKDVDAITSDIAEEADDLLSRIEIGQ